MQEAEAFEYHGERSSAEDREFDQYIGALEEVLMDNRFSDVQSQFCEKYCGNLKTLSDFQLFMKSIVDEFEDSDEYKLSYTRIHEEYVEIVEKLLVESMSRKIDAFDMNRFETLLSERKDEIGDDILSILLSFDDIEEFKELMLSHKKEKTEESKSLAVYGKRMA